MKFVVADIVNPQFNQYSLEETKILIQNLWGVIDKVFLQPRNYASSASYIGTWKAREIAQRCLDNKIDVFVINNMIRPSVYNTLRKYFPRETQIRDKIDLILNIFEKHAKTKEARLQIEYARIRYELPRYKGLGKELSNLGAWIGTRGPGERIMEIKRRHLEKRLNHIKKQLKQWQKVLDSQRRWREGMNTFLLMGYSNVGKSSLFNALTWKDVLVKDILFATLDNRIGRLKTTHPIDLLVIDTIWFIHGIPPLVINSFLPILEEAKRASTIGLVLDASLLVKDPAYFDIQFDTILGVFNRINWLINQGQNLLIIFNKKDLVANPQQIETKISKYLSQIKQKTPFNKIERHFGSAESKDDVNQLKTKLLKLTNDKSQS